MALGFKMGGGESDNQRSRVPKREGWEERERKAHEVEVEMLYATKMLVATNENFNQG